MIHDFVDPPASRFADAALAMVGTRWRRRSTDPEHGLNCGGLVVAALARVGILVGEPPDHDAGMPPPDMLWSICRTYGDDVPWSDCGEGRVGLCSWSPGGNARHLVVMIAGERIVHCDAMARRVVVSPARWMEGKLLGAFRVRGLNYGDPWQRSL